MADKKLSSVSAVSDMNYVYAETASGDTVKISKADLASVVAGLIGCDFIDRGQIFDLNNATTPGRYFVNSYAGLQNAPSGNVLGVMSVFKSGAAIVQQIISGTTVHLRRYYDGSWTDWF